MKTKMKAPHPAPLPPWASQSFGEDREKNHGWWDVATEWMSYLFVAFDRIKAMGCRPMRMKNYPRRSGRSALAVVWNKPLGKNVPLP